MTCVELQKSLAEAEDGSTVDQKAHLETCAKCATLVAELHSIASVAVELRDADEPSPRVWNSIEIALRREGLIHPHRTKTSHSLLPSLGSQWRWASWLVPAAAMLLIAVAFYVRHQPTPSQFASDVVSQPAPEAVSDLAIAGLNDNDLLQEIAEQAPALREQYTDNLRRVNEYIQDAKGVVAANPNDEEARRSLLEAYQEKAMLFDLAMDRALP